MPATRKHDIEECWCAGIHRVSLPAYGGSRKYSYKKAHSPTAASSPQRLGAYAAIGSFLTAFFIIAPVAVWNLWNPYDPDTARIEITTALRAFYVQADQLIQEGLALKP